MKPITERYELQDEEHFKPPAPPLAAQTTGAIGVIFGLKVHQRYRSGVTVAILKFPSGTPKNWPPRGSGTPPLERQKIVIHFSLNFDFFTIGMCDGMF